MMAFSLVPNDVTGLLKAMPMEPYFLAHYGNGELKTSGLNAAFFGHRLASGEAEADGIFAEWQWSEKVLRVRNDRYGFYPLYYFNYKGAFGISPSILTLLRIGAPRDLDYAALAIFLRLEFFIGENTPFTAIRTVPPNAILEWKDGNLRLESHRPSVQEQQLSRTAALDAYVDLFRSAIKRRAPYLSDFGLLLSGGRDSRHIFLELLSQGHKPAFAVTAHLLPPMANDDVSVARRLCEALNVNHVVLDHPKKACRAELTKNIITDWCSWEHAWLLPAVEFLNWAKCRINYDGIGGDVLSNGLYLTSERVSLVRQRRLSDLADELLGNEERFGMVATSVRSQLDRRQAADTLTRELERYTDFPNPLGAFIFWNRTRRDIALSPYRLFKGIETVYSPYLDHKVYDLLIGLSDTYMVSHVFHDEAIEKAFPQYAHIPYAAKTSSLSADSAGSSLYSLYTLDMMHLLAGEPSPCVKGRYLWPRLLRCLFDAEYSGSVMWFAPLALFFMQLTHICVASPAALVATLLRAERHS